MEKHDKTSLTPKKFTSRQLEIVQLWSELPNENAIAEQLNISHHSVHTHLRRLREKLGVTRTFDVFKHLVKTGQLTIN